MLWYVELISLTLPRQQQLSPNKEVNCHLTDKKVPIGCLQIAVTMQKGVYDCSVSGRIDDVIPELAGT